MNFSISVLRSLVFQIVIRFHQWSLNLRMFGKRLQLKTAALLVSLLSVVSKFFEKLASNRIVDHLEKYGFFLISSVVLGFLDQLQIFSQSYLIELLGVLTNLGLLELWHLIYLRLLAAFGMLVYFTN